MTRLIGLKRGVEDPEAVAAFFAWLLDVEPKGQGDEFSLNFGNGSLVIHGGIAEPVSVTFSGTDIQYRGPDPDGVPVIADPALHTDTNGGPVRLDHLRLNCADLYSTATFYRGLGCEYTWSGRGENELDSDQESPLEGATWLHLSGDDGYVSLSQADWKHYGRGKPASGPPRFIHIGLAVSSLADVVGRLDGAGVRYLRGNPAVGSNIYLNDPQGDPSLGSNIEIIQYRPDARRSGSRHVESAER